MRWIHILILLSCFAKITYGQNWKLVWSDEFEGSELNLKNWNYETGNGEGGWGTGQMDYCTDRPENVKVSKGRLKLGITKEDLGGFHYTAGRINSKNKVTAKYGRIEARIKIPAGRGIGAAFWMLPQDERFGWWPRSGEIDILETNGHEIHRNYGTVHYMLSEQRKYTGHDIISNHDLSKEFHVYAIEWDERVMNWYLDDSLYHTFSIAEAIDGRTPFNERFFFILSTGVGSDFSGKQIDDKLLPQSMEVDYVRVYKRVYNPLLKRVISNESGTQLELHFSEHVKPLLAPLSFKINGDFTGNITSVQHKYRENNVLVVNLSSVISSGAYSVSLSQGAVKSSEDQVSIAVDSFPVVNTTPGASPCLLDGKLLQDSYGIELTMSKSMSFQATYEGFRITKNGKHQKVMVKLDTLRPTKFLLYTNEPFMQRDTVFVEYDPGSVQGKDGAALLKGTIQCQNDLPFKSIIPGILECENYFQQSGVQKESCMDSSGGENIGYIDDRDYLEYWVFVTEEGDYKMTFRAAAMQYNPTLIAEIDGQKVKSILPQTFGWQTWKDSQSDYFTLRKGVYRIKFTAERGGFNLNWIRFEKRAKE
jgi:beta-glucanase (GH16 family)